MKGKTILITGGTGSLATRFIEKALSREPKKLIVYSRGEDAQVKMRRRIADPENKIRYFIGDVRDRDRLYRALKGVDWVLHTAALKHIDVSHYNPRETVLTNIIGTLNTVEMAIDNNVKKVLIVSSDKACSPCNLYGASKMCAEQLALACRAYAPEIIISVVRYGNFVTSRGNVVEYFNLLKHQGKKELPIHDLRSTRFWISLNDAAEFAFQCLDSMQGGEIFTPSMASARIRDVAKVIHPNAELRDVGLRAGEKLHEIIEDAHGVRCTSSELPASFGEVKELLLK